MCVSHYHNITFQDLSWTIAARIHTDRGSVLCGHAKDINCFELIATRLYKFDVSVAGLSSIGLKIGRFLSDTVVDDSTTIFHSSLLST